MTILLPGIARVDQTDPVRRGFESLNRAGTLEHCDAVVAEGGPDRGGNIGVFAGQDPRCRLEQLHARPQSVEDRRHLHSGCARADYQHGCRHAREVPRVAVGRGQFNALSTGSLRAWPPVQTTNRSDRSRSPMSTRDGVRIPKSDLPCALMNLDSSLLQFLAQNRVPAHVLDEPHRPEPEASGNRRTVSPCGCHIVPAGALRRTSRAAGQRAHLQPPGRPLAAMPPKRSRVTSAVRTPRRAARVTPRRRPARRRPPYIISDIVRLGHRAMLDAVVINGELAEERQVRGSLRDGCPPAGRRGDRDLDAMTGREHQDAARLETRRGFGAEDAVALVVTQPMMGRA